jgi:O-antigen biosynthesis protein
MPSRANIPHVADNYWDTLVRFDPAAYALPRAFYDDFLTVAWDEARHFQLVDDRLRALGSFYGALPATLALLEHAANTTSALAARIAVVPLVQEARGLDSGSRLVHKLQSLGDKASAAIVRQIVFEERNHVACGIKWFKHLCDHVEHVDAVPYFHELVLEHFPEGLPGPFDMESRLAADMDAAWYQPLEAKARQYASAASSSQSSKSTQSARLQAFAASKKQVIVAGSVWPERTSSAAGVRSSDLIEIFQSHGYSVVCVSPSRLNAHTESLARDHNVLCVQADANTDAFQKLLQETHPQVVVFDRFTAEEMYGWQARQYAPTALRVLDLQDVHFLRRARELLVTKRGVPFTETLDVKKLLLEGADLEKHVVRELASIHRSDLTLFVSGVEKEVLVDRFQIPEELLHRCDFFYPPVPEPRDLKSYGERQDMAFIGSFKHAPNVDGVTWLQQSIAPLFRSLHSSTSKARVPEIHIYGSYSQDAKRFQKLHDPANGVKLMGFAADVHETLGAYRLSVAPLRFGAGIKGKIADSWFNGTPCVATSIGAEGMGDPGHGWGGLVADDERDFAHAMRDLYTDETAWGRAQRAGRLLCSARYDKSRNASSLMARLEKALVIRDQQRSENWTGRILWSEKYRATEFMSRFIRLKNETQQQARQAAHSRPVQNE